MYSQLKQLARSTFSGSKVHLTRQTEKSDVTSLLQRLRPKSFGGELIRMGPQGDGGYLVPNNLFGIKACFSPGVNKISGFEADCAKRGIKVFLADRSVDGPAEKHELFHFTKKYLGVTTNEDFMTLDDWVESSMPNADEDLILQIDVEGFEYEIFLAASDQLMKRFRIIVVEFHRLHELWNQPYFTVASRVFDKLLQTHQCIHNHPNNRLRSVKTKQIEIPMLAEFTFLRHDHVGDSLAIESFPHPLDFDNVPSRPPLQLPQCWYQ